MMNSNKHQLNESEINEFLARSGSEGDDSDWDNVGEIDAEEILKPESSAPGPSTKTKKVTGTKETKKIVSYRQISDVGIDVLFGSAPTAGSASNDTKSKEPSRPNVEEEEEEAAAGFLNPTGSFVKEKLRMEDRRADEQRVEWEIRRQERTELSRERAKTAASAPPAPESKVGSHVLAAANMKDYFVPSGTCIRVVKPRISSETWQDRIVSRKVCQLSLLRPNQLEELSASDWLTVGVIVYAPDVRRSKGGTGPPYSIWRLSDLDNLDRIVSLFLFGAAHQKLWKEATTGLVVAFLRPKQLSSAPSGGSGQQSTEVTLTIDNPQQALVLGQSKDFATCNSRTKAGAMCLRIVNRALCEYCEFHVRQLYRNAGNKRAGFAQAIGAQAKRLAGGLDGAGSGRGAKRSPSLLPSRVKDVSGANASGQLRILQKLGGPGAAHLMTHIGQARSNGATASSGPTPGPSQPTASRVPTPTASQPRTPKSASLLKEKSHATPTRPAQSPSTTGLTFNSFLKTIEANRGPVLSDPTKDWLKTGLRTVLGKSPAPRLSDPSMDVGRARALALARASGGVQAMQEKDRRQQVLHRLEVENTSRPDDDLKLAATLRRKRASDSGVTVFPVGKGPLGEAALNKRQRLLASVSCKSEEELKREIARGSRHTELVATEEKAQEERYFRALEFRERYEEKLAAVREHPVRVVSCSVCHYLAEGHKPNPNCEVEHPAALRFGKGRRRYFACKDCRERTTTLEKIPTRNCRKCGGSNFERTGMLKERKGPKLVDETLQPRGEEHARFLTQNV